MVEKLSARLAGVVDALPLRSGLRVLEIGCGPGAAAREVARRVGPDGFVLGVDRSAKAITSAVAGSEELIAAGVLEFRQSAADDFTLAADEAPYDLAFAIRVGALDGRHPNLEQTAKQHIAAALTPTGKLFIDGGTPLRQLNL